VKGSDVHDQPRKFQSHNGAIAAGISVWDMSAVDSVSIPQWCDCCSVELTTQTLTLLFQSHNGAIAARHFRKRQP